MNAQARSAEITRLTEQAKILRRAPPDEWEDNGLSALVEKINALRAEDERERQEAFIAELRESLVDSCDEEPQEEPAKRGPGRPKKVA